MNCLTVVPQGRVKLPVRDHSWLPDGSRGSHYKKVSGKKEGEDSGSLSQFTNWSECALLGWETSSPIGWHVEPVSPHVHNPLLMSPWSGFFEHGSNLIDEFDFEGLLSALIER
jgi:hypothetical protein